MHIIGSFGHPFRPRAKRYEKLALTWDNFKIPSASKPCPQTYREDQIEPELKRHAHFNRRTAVSRRRSRLLPTAHRAARAPLPQVRPGHEDPGRAAGLPEPPSTRAAQ